MFHKLILILVASLCSSTIGIPLESEPQHDLSRFLDTRIVGGVQAPPGYGKHMAALVWGRTTTHLMCGGSIVTRYHILSAAHCIEPMVVWGQLIASYRAAIGSNKWASTERNIHFIGFANHPHWNWYSLKNDIGVLFLAEVIRPGGSVAIIPLNFKWVGSGVSSYVTGWGRLGTHKPVPDYLQLLYVYTIPPWLCLKKIDAAAEWWGSTPAYDPELEICTFHSYGHGMCNGDSGSAVVEKDTQKQIGIVSWGFPCARGGPDVHVRISAFQDFLTRTLGLDHNNVNITTNKTN